MDPGSSRVIACRLECMPASVPSPQIAVTGPNPANPDHSDPTAAASHQLSVEGSVHQEPKSRSQKGEEKYHTNPRSSFGCSPAMQAGRLPLFRLFQP
ncbi:uncharacterized protein ASPGLDRAFT_53362 [Aspergillus glaucus CBS 516.65]|uniref:Uncharacterized protein n=1 Tax=Aspergillus glaucus CBS 516.65 TaxID=1160497 RepID=A0A1L9V4E8_ASPGL|nr:hypothetical protein ASPGLDRAFT_53362 [Aspergillus glaucus CBS 516.65]OJJ78771.1 hypothetical protein ASPGLDRAFT_53362 [Aspergillus glaucus CBS 516.65]